MNDNDKMTQEKMQIIGEQIINGFHDAFEQAQKDLGHGIPIVLLASIIGSEIKLISGKEPRFLEMVLAACDRRRNVCRTCGGYGMIDAGNGDVLDCGDCVAGIEIFNVSEDI